MCTWGPSGKDRTQTHVGSELLSLSGQILSWCDSGIYICITSGWNTLVIWLSQWLNRTGALDKKPLLVIRRNYIFVWDKTTKGREELLSTPGGVNVCKDKIWPDLHLGLRTPFLSFFRTSPGLRMLPYGKEQFFCWEDGDCRLQFKETENVHSKAQMQLLSPLD